MTLPSISIVSVSYNTPIWLWEKSLNAIRRQEYPQDKIEHIIIDAGSPAQTIRFIRKFRTQVYIQKNLVEKPLARMSYAIRLAKGSLVLFLEPDNIIVGTQWLKEMVHPFLVDDEIISTSSMHNTYEPDMPMFTKYCALFGFNDPLLYYLDKSDKLPRFTHSYHKGTVKRVTDGYTTVEFSKQSLPTFGDNGHMVRRKALLSAHANEESFVHTDVFARLVGMGYRRFGIVHNSIIHYTGSSIIEFYRRRIESKQRYFDTQRKSRDYLVFDASSRRDQVRLFFFIIYSLTFVQPFALSVRGYFSIPELAWFYHPVACFIGVLYYGFSEIRIIVHRMSSKFGHAAPSIR